MSETKAALVIGLVIIIGFGFVLAQVKGTGEDSALSPRQAIGGEFTRRALELTADDMKVEDLRRGAPRFEPKPIARMPRREEGGAGEIARTPRGVQPRAVTPPPATRTYTVLPKESLSRIARKVYGSSHPKYYKLIYEANKDKMPDIATVRAGQKLVIPAPPADAPIRSVRLGSGVARRSVAMRVSGTR